MKFYNEEAEGMVLCALMIDKAAVERLHSQLFETDFDKAIHRAAFADIVRLHRANNEADMRSVCMEFEKRGERDSVAYIASLTDLTYTAANVDYYVSIIKDLSIKRSIAKALEEARIKLDIAGETGVEISGELEREISSINLNACGSEYRKAHTYMETVAEQIEWNIRTQGQIRGVDSHFNSLRDITGFRNGEYIIVAARPSVGKTALALNLIESIAIKRKIPAGFFSVEMTAKQLSMRLVSSLTGLNSWGINTGVYKSTAQMDRIMQAMAEIADAPLYIDETSGIKISEIKTKARRMVHIDKVQIIFIDYMSLIDAEQPRLARHEQVAEISRSIKGLAKELNIPIVMLSQIVRDYEGKRPTLSALAESRSLEQDADVVIFLHRDREVESDMIPTELIVMKNRNGPIGTCNLIYNPKLTKFSDTDVAKTAD